MPVAVVSSDPAAVSVAGELGGLTARLRRALRRGLRTVLVVDPLPAPAAELLALVAREAGLRIGDVARALVVAPNTASTLVAQLAAAGLVERLPDGEDRRVARLAVTPAGAARLAVWHDQRQGLLSEALGRLSPADRRVLGAALPALARLVAALEAREPS